MKKIYLFATIILFGFCLHAQIVYTNVNPDATSSGTYNLDLNNDGTTDFVINPTTKFVKSSGKCKGQSGTNHYFRITPLNNNRVLDYNGANARMMAPNELIDASASTWNGNSNQLMVSYEWDCRLVCIWGGCGYLWSTFSSGQWYPGDGFLGLKLISGGHTYYGWVQINIPYGADNFTVRDYAYSSTVDQPIFAGQSSTEYILIPANATILNPLCAGNNVTIPYIITGTFSSSNIVSAELSDATGSFANQVTVGSIVSNVSGNINALIPANMPSGYGYRIRVTSSNPARTSYPNGGNLEIAGGPPYADIYSTNNITNLCVADVHLQALTQSCNSYQWKFNGNNIPGATTSSFDAGVVGDYTCEITNGVGTVISNTITVNSEPPSITIYEDHANCNGYVVVYAIDDNSDNILSNFQWKLNGVDIPGATSFGYRTTATGDYSCVKSNNCGSTTSNTISVTNDQLFMADATITSVGPTAICSGQAVLNANTGTGLNYQWYNGYDAIPGAINSSYSASVSGGYSVRETNSSGCLRDKSISILIGAPFVNIGYSSPLSICHNHPVNLYTSYQYTYEESNATNLSLQWIKDDADIPGATGSGYDARDPGTYSVRATITPGGCSGTSAGVQISSCSNSNTVASSNSSQKEISSLSEDLQSLSVAPNPISGSTKISFTLKQSEKISLRIYDMNGRLIKTFTEGMFTAGSHQLEWNASNIGAGVYLLRMETAGYSESRKLIVVK